LQLCRQHTHCIHTPCTHTRTTHHARWPTQPSRLRTPSSPRTRSSWRAGTTPMPASVTPRCWTSSPSCRWCRRCTST
jgi:hypothetical protein